MVDSFYGLTSDDTPGHAFFRKHYEADRDLVSHMKFCVCGPIKAKRHVLTIGTEPTAVRAFIGLVDSD